ncbi:MAG: serine hydrolase [Flavobacteriaceae bacterium]|nr:MAG: serine hydrolase [Flavobacteriaceae bacterium]
MKKIITLLSISVFITSVCAQTNTLTSKKLTQELEQIHAQGFINGFSVVIVNKDSVLYTKGFGFSDIKAHKQYTENTIQNIGSISKTFIGIALLKAQELGALQLDDPINKHLPFKIINPYFPNEQITIRQLSTHTSSIKDPVRYYKNGYVLKEKDNPGVKVNANFRSPDEKLTMEIFFKNILTTNGIWHKKKNFLKEKPGTRFEYSNIAAALAAYILEQATKESFPEFTRKHIFKPLGMQNTGWSFKDIDFSMHSKLYDSPKTELAFYSLITYPDGGLLTSSKDMGNYLSELVKGYTGNGTILKQNSFKELFKKQLSAKNYKERSENRYGDEYNSGVFMGFSAKGYIGHTGSDPGVVTFMFFNAETKIGRLLILNTELKKEGIQEFIAIWNKLEEYENNLH